MILATGYTTGNKKMRFLLAWCLHPVEETENKLVLLKICHESCEQGVMRANNGWIYFSPGGLGRRPLEVIFELRSKGWVGGRPWWRSGWESACQCRGHGFEPWSGKIPHAAEQLGPWATAAEPVRLEPVLHNKEAAMVRGPRTAMKSGPSSPQLEKALAQKRGPSTAKNK